LPWLEAACGGRQIKGSHDVESMRANLAADLKAESTDRPRRLGPVLFGAAAALLLAAGVLMWSRYGPAVFSDVVLAALAWCF
jgi:hypothetical protein